MMLIDQLGCVVSDAAFGTFDRTDLSLKPECAGFTQSIIKVGLDAYAH